MEDHELDIALTTLQAAMAEAQTLTNITISLRQNADRLLALLKSLLEELKAAIDAVLPMLP